MISETLAPSFLSQRYADYLDACCALVGRAPNAGAHRARARRATLVIDCGALLDAGPAGGSAAAALGDALWPTLGYACGALATHARVPAVVGLDGLAPSRDELKAFSAAFGTTAAAALFHMVGVTPEAPTLRAALALGGDDEPDEADGLDDGGGGGGAIAGQAAGVETVALAREQLVAAWRALDSGAPPPADAAAPPRDERGAVDVVALGNPHLSLGEVAELRRLVGEAGADARKHPDVRVIATLSRAVLRDAETAGHRRPLEDFGVEFVNDTCWCMLGDTVPYPPVTAARALITNSGARVCGGVKPSLFG